MVKRDKLFMQNCFIKKYLFNLTRMRNHVFHSRSCFCGFREMSIWGDDYYITAAELDSYEQFLKEL